MGLFHISGVIPHMHAEMQESQFSVVD